MNETERLPLSALEGFLSLPFVVLGAGLLVSWVTAVEPATVSEQWRYHGLYASLYQMMPVLGGGTLLIGVLNSLHLGWVLYSRGDGRVE